MVFICKKKKKRKILIEHEYEKIFLTKRRGWECLWSSSPLWSRRRSSRGLEGGHAAQLCGHERGLLRRGRGASSRGPDGQLAGATEPEGHAIHRAEQDGPSRWVAMTTTIFSAFVVRIGIGLNYSPYLYIFGFAIKPKACIVWVKDWMYCEDVFIMPNFIN